MAKYKRYEYCQSILIPVCFEEQLMPGSLEFAIHTLVETRMDMSVFDDNYHNDETGRRAYDPKMLLKVVLFAYCRGLVSSRRIERAGCENVTFMALSGNQRPDHSTIAAFVSCMKEEIVPLFRDILLVCEQENLLGGTFFAWDGLKLPGNASKRWSGTLSDISKKKEKIEQKVKHLLEEQISADKEDRDSLLDPLSREKQIEKLQKQAERIERWLEENDAKIGANGRELQSNVTDNESAKMMTSHGTIQGYNGQALVDKKHQVIMHAEAFGSGQDNQHLAPMVDGAKGNLKKIGQSEDYFEGAIFTADTNYHNQSTLEKCQEEKLDAYIPDLKFRTRDKRFATQSRYQPKKGKKFVLHDFKLDVPIGAAENNFSKAMLEKVDSDRGRKIYPQRMAIVEPVFANIRTQKRMDRFTLKGKIKVNIQWMLYCMVHNIEKIMNYATA
jgi:transposase